MITPSKAIIPPEIPILNKGMASTVFIGLTFATATDRDGVTVAKFDVKSDRGGTSIECRPTLGELLSDEAPRDMSQSDFDTKTSGLHGIQRTSSPFTLSPTNADNFDSLPRTVLQHLNLVSESTVDDSIVLVLMLIYISIIYPQKSIGKWTGKGCFVGTLPSSGQEVYVTITCDKKTGNGNVHVCCNDAMAANSLLNLLKQTLK